MDETTQKTLFGILFTALAGMYGFFIKHVAGHVSCDQIKNNQADIKTLFDTKQDNKTCEQIVKRMDENHAETCKKLDAILEKL